MTDAANEPLPHPPTVMDALRLMGFDSVADLHNCILLGVIGKRSATSAHPKSAPGLNAWSEIVGAIRMYLADRGWDIDDPDNLPRAVSPDGDRALVIYTGDRATGRSPLPARTRGRKGRTAKRIIQANVERDGQGVLNFEDGEPDEEIAKMPDTWSVLFFIDEETEEVRIELSRPTGMGGSNYIDTWLPRFTIPPMSLSGEAPMTPDDGDEDGGIDVPVRRR